MLILVKASNISSQTFYTNGWLPFTVLWSFSTDSNVDSSYSHERLFTNMSGFFETLIELIIFINPVKRIKLRKPTKSIKLAKSFTCIHPYFPSNQTINHSIDRSIDQSTNEYYFLFEPFHQSHRNRRL